MVLQIDNLKFGYLKNKLIFDDFSLNLQLGEIASIVGSSGSGKSTLLELICKNQKPFAGSIKSGKIAMIFQDPYSSFHQSYTILEQIKDVTKDTSSIKQLARILKLGIELLDKKPHLLSGGQLQRCSILRAILMKPDLLLADEPTSALDNVVALEVMKLLISFLPNISILLVTHDLELASWCSDKIINLNEGKL